MGGGGGHCPHCGGGACPPPGVPHRPHAIPYVRRTKSRTPARAIREARRQAARASRARRPRAGQRGSGQDLRCAQCHSRTSVPSDQCRSACPAVSVIGGGPRASGKVCFALAALRMAPGKEISGQGRLPRGGRQPHPCDQASVDRRTRTTRAQPQLECRPNGIGSKRLPLLLLPPHVPLGPRDPPPPNPMHSRRGDALHKGHTPCTRMQSQSTEETRGYTSEGRMGHDARS